MPVILTPEQEDVWLSQEANEQLDLLSDLLNQKPQHQMDIYPISSEVNNAKNNKAELLQKASYCIYRGCNRYRLATALLYLVSAAYRR